jgi:single-stranded-DNA-specific exonuclease
VAAEFERPTLLLSEEGAFFSGSGRTWGKVLLHARLSPVARRHARDFGGHAAAIGLTVPASAFEAFRADARAVFAAERDEDEWTSELVADSELSPVEADEELARSIAALEPHGVSNPKALFFLRRLRLQGKATPVGRRGLRFRLSGDGATIPAVWWTADGEAAAMKNRPLDVLANLAIDSWSGRPTLTVADLSPSP